MVLYDELEMENYLIMTNQFYRIHLLTKHVLIDNYVTQYIFKSISTYKMTIYIIWFFECNNKDASKSKQV